MNALERLLSSWRLAELWSVLVETSAKASALFVLTLQGRLRAILDAGQSRRRMGPRGI